MIVNKSDRARQIKLASKRLGFDFCGISKAQYLEEEAPRLETWLNQGMHGKMSYMENHFDKRLDPTLLVPGAKSIVSLIYNHYPHTDLAEKQKQTDGANLKIAKYAYGEDYHFVLKRKLKDLVDHLKGQIGDFNGRVFVDSAPVLERVWAQRSGLGWIGKNSLLLNKKMGSFFFLAELILDIELEPDSPVKDYCGSCSRCMDACPTDAIPSPYVVDASKCISYLTIELKDEIPKTFAGKMEGWTFGCDICQDVCPWNRFSRSHKEKAFIPSEKLEKMSDQNWGELTEEVFRETFKRSAVKRTKYEGLKRNIRFALRNKDRKNPDSHRD